jgi:predicted transcriptional regulator
MSEDIPRRSRWEISYDILEATSEEEKAHGGKAKKTRIMQEAHLDWRNFHRYFNFLLEHEFIVRQKGEDYYHLTEKGMNLKRHLKDLTDLLQQPKSISQNLF